MQINRDTNQLYFVKLSLGRSSREIETLNKFYINLIRDNKKIPLGVQQWTPDIFKSF